MGTHIAEEEILVNILIKLPVKSIFRFKCVSKSWKTLFCEPHFKRKHLNHAKNQFDSQKLLIGSNSLGKKDFNLYCTSLSPNRVLAHDMRKVFWPSIFEPSSAFKIYCCCDALFLMGIWIGPSREEPSMLLVWNPTTSETIVLPPLGSPKQDSTYGLGYDSISDDYKVLRVDKEGSALAEILALKSGYWRKTYSPSTSNDGDSSLLWCGKESLSFVNGAFHWLGMGGIVALNISDETYRRIPSPKNVLLLPKQHKVDTMIEMGISVLKRTLCVFNNDEITFNLWIMKEYGVDESWTKLLTLPSNGAISVLPIYSFPDGKVLLRHQSRDPVILFGKVIYRTCDDRIWLDDIKLGPFSTNGFVYTESLINPNIIK